ncbi:hypothetical protein [Streptomyces sp. NPDC048438]|uniref:hypothetical protein n=1 Tax=Streptomyces sp. NPDC048438 TaxID=3365551 RepID=UPI0037180600
MCSSASREFRIPSASRNKGNGRFDVFFAGVNGASTPTTDVNGVLDVADDLAMISAYLQEAAARRED